MRVEEFKLLSNSSCRVTSVNSIATGEDDIEEEESASESEIEGEGEIVS